MPETINPAPEEAKAEKKTEGGEEEIEEVVVSADDEPDDAEAIDEAEEKLEGAKEEDAEATAEQLKACKEKLAEYGVSEEGAEIAAKIEAGKTVSKEDRDKLDKEAATSNKFSKYAIGSAVVGAGALYAGWKILKLFFYEAWVKGGTKSFGAAVKEGYEKGKKAAEEQLGVADKKK